MKAEEKGYEEGERGEYVDIPVEHRGYLSSEKKVWQRGSYILKKIYPNHMPPSSCAQGTVPTGKWNALLSHASQRFCDRTKH